MAIDNIDYDKCISCGTCKDGCPVDVIRWDEAKDRPEIKYVADCQICGICAEYCPVEAITITPTKLVPMATGWFS